jgi:dephospho-CoA kinase
VTAPALRVGLTGGIASGKTTIAATFRRLGAVVVDADDVARGLLEPGGSGHAAVVERFGSGVVGPDGRIDRAELARLVFSDPMARSDLDGLLHPRILREAERRLELGLHLRPAPVAVLEAALLVETGLHRRFDRLVVAACGRAAQLQRLLARGLSEREAEARLDAQAPLEAKLAVADFVVDTDGTLDSTRTRAERVYLELLAEHARRSDSAAGEGTGSRG